MTIKELLAKIDGQQRQINEMHPLPGETVTFLRDYYKTGLTWSSNAMEGNTLTESETKVVIESGLQFDHPVLKPSLNDQGVEDKRVRDAFCAEITLPLFLADHKEEVSLPPGSYPIPFRLGNWKEIIYAYRAELLFVFKA